MYIFYFNLSFVHILVIYIYIYIYFNRKPITVYLSSLEYLHLLIHVNCMYELAAHVRATPLRRALNSNPLNIINVFFMFYRMSDFYCTTVWRNK